MITLQYPFGKKSNLYLLELNSALESYISRQTTSTSETNILKADDENGQCFLRFKGSLDDLAVLTTDNATFSVKNSQVSNTMLLTDFGNETINVLNSCSNVLQCDLILPRLNKLKNNLPLYNPSSSSTNQSIITIEYLETEVQASLDEIMIALDRWNAVSIDGSWYLLDLDYCLEVVEFICCLLREQDLSLTDSTKNIQLDNLFEDVDCYPMVILKHCFNLILTKGRVGGLLCKSILRKHERISYDVFINQFNEASDRMSLDVVFSDDLLQGLCISSSDKVLLPFFEESLSMDLNERFSLLFQKMSVWTHDQLMPYICTLSPDSKLINAALQQFTRSYSSSNTRMYCTKIKLS